MNEDSKNKTIELLMGHGQPPQKFDAALANVFETATSVMLEKRRARGPGNISEQGRYGVLERLRHDKLARVARTIEREQFIEIARRLELPQRTMETLFTETGIRNSSEGTLRDPAFVDDIVDVINYAAILLLMTFNWWELPLLKEQED